MAVMLIFWLGTSVACWVRVLGGFFPLSVGGFNTFFPDLWKLSLDTLLGKGLKLRGPHSLGTLIEWKRLCYSIAAWYFYGPHSLGTLIEWKQTFGCHVGNTT